MSMDFKQLMPIPQGSYQGIIDGWSVYKGMWEKTSQTAAVSIAITRGPFKGRKLFYHVVTAGVLARLASELNVFYNAESTVQEVLDLLPGRTVCIEVSIVATSTETMVNTVDRVAKG